jgi:outer membrane protein OmpA-like peptidoglycan-associated protein/opacity protein-like surface antigen
MMKKILNVFTVVFVLSFLFLSGTSNAQFKDYNWKAGLQINNMLPMNEFSLSNGFRLSPLGRGYIRYELSHDWSLEGGIGFGIYQGVDDKGDDYSTTILPIDARILYTPFDMEKINPYFFAGFGALNFNASTKTTMKSPASVEESGWTGVIPVGAGLEFNVGESLILDLSASFNYTLSDDVNYYKIVDMNDAYINVGLGLTFLGDDGNTDRDHDGLMKRIEKEIGTNPDNPDTDGDGLKDGEEYLTYKTDPLKADTDGDGLNDGDEVFKYKTDPLKADTDGDGLNDGDEILKFQTDPLKADTDGDGLKDGEEVLKYKSNPLKTDTDGDGLNDGEEVLKYKTDPLKVDTDGGTIGDGVEVKRGTNPLDPSDDVPKTKVMVDKEQGFENVLFGFDKYSLTKKAKKQLDNIYESVTAIPDAKVSLAGHCDSIGPKKYNQKLSEKRAASVQKYLVKKGLNESIITSEGFGKEKPIAPNKTAADRQKNRRVEVKALYKVLEEEKK